LDEKLIQFGLDGIKSSNVTYGHRFITQGAITVCHPNDYLSSLEKVYVIVDHKKRQQGIVKVVNRAAQAMGGKPLIERDLLNWVNFLVEYPIAISGKINPDFLELPAPILITAMKHHQKCFAVQNVDGNLLASFVAVIDNPMAKVESVQRGLEMVLEARLADAMFFYKGDLKIKLSLRFSKLKDIIFQADLGSLLEKVKRLERLTGWLAEGIVPQKKDIVMRAALLSKTDLTTQMVKEFPELEGVVGGIYAQKQGEAQAISNAISEQYLPIEAGGALPQTIEGTLLALADKIDTLVGYFALDIVPTGTTDPFALRRKAIGILRILNEKNLKFSLFDFIDLAFKAYGERFINQREEATKKIIDFFKNRLASLLSEKGYPPSVIEAVLAVFNGKVKETFSKADALFSFSKTPAFIPLVIAYKRVHRIIETPILNSVDPNLFKAPQQKALYEKYLQIKKNIDNLVKQGNYLEVLELLKTLKPFIDDFFDHVMVMVDDKKRSKNSLALLTKIKELFLEVADLSKFPI
jgi:glycyl-tRNA synthetase beta chain